jgi:hypothetical protein
MEIMKDKRKKPKGDQLRFEYAVKGTTELVFEDSKGKKVKYKAEKKKD